MHDADIVIIGAGLTGLRAALEVSQAGLSVLIIEKSTQVGGRLKTSTIGGALLDHGFQVILDGYPEFASIPNFDKLECKAFWSGARIRIDSQTYDLLDPRRHPKSLLSSILSPIVSTRDIIKLAIFLYGASPYKVIPSGISTADALDQAGFTEIFKSGLLRPFLRGVLLDPKLTCDSGLARFYLRMFTKGAAVLPAHGIQALPNHLADLLGRQHILLNTSVVKLSSRSVILDNGEEIRAKCIICAVDTLSAAALGGNEQTVPQSSNTTMYFAAKHPPYSEPILMLNSDSKGPVNNLAVPSNVQPSYSPSGRALISASIIGEHEKLPKDKLLTLVITQMHEWFGSQVADWEHLQTFTILNALPARPRLTDGWYQKEGVYFAGDYLSYGSQNGALCAGRTVARHLLAEISE